MATWLHSDGADGHMAALNILVCSVLEDLITLTLVVCISRSCHVKYKLADGQYCYSTDGQYCYSTGKESGSL